VLLVGAVAVMPLGVAYAHDAQNAQVRRCARPAQLRKATWEAHVLQTKEAALEKAHLELDKTSAAIHKLQADLDTERPQLDAA